MEEPRGFCFPGLRWFLAVQLDLETALDAHLDVQDASLLVDGDLGYVTLTVEFGCRWMRPRLKDEAGLGYLPNSMYHHGFAMLGLSEAYGAVDESLLWQEGAAGRRRSIGEALKLAVKLAVTSQEKNQWGGWRYTPTSTDADTSVTGAMLMGLLAARNAGIEVPDQTITKALEYMQRSTGKDGSVAYSGGMGGMGESMNRSAIATLVMSVGRHKDWEQFKAALKHITGLLEHRESSYPEYYRYYMAQALFQGDYEAWQKWNAALVRQFHQTQNADGSFSNGSYGTGMSLLALALNFRFLPIYER